MGVYVIMKKVGEGGRKIGKMGFLLTELECVGKLRFRLVLAVKFFCG